MLRLLFSFAVFRLNADFVVAWLVILVTCRRCNEFCYRSTMTRCSRRKLQREIERRQEDDGEEKRANEVFPFLCVSSASPVLYLHVQSERRMKNEMRQTHRLERQPTVRSWSGNSDEPTTSKCAAKKRADRMRERKKARGESATMTCAQAMLSRVLAA